MSGFGRIAGGLVLTGLVSTAALALSPAASAQAAAQDGIYVSVNPSTIQAGYQVEITASCGDNLNPARVSSGAFGEVTLNADQRMLLLYGSATVPADTRADEYRVNLRCANGSTATAQLFVLGSTRPTRGPSTGGGGTAALDPARPGSQPPGLQSPGSQPPGSQPPAPGDEPATDLTAAPERPAGGLTPMLVGGASAAALAVGVGLLLARRRAG